MTLAIQSDLTLDENLGVQSGTGDDDASGLSVAIQAVADAALTGLTTASGTGFPQYAHQLDIADSDKAVTAYSLVGPSGNAFPAGGTPTDFEVGGVAVYLFATSNPQVVIGRIGAAGDVAVVIIVEDTIENGLATQADLWMVQYAPLTHATGDKVDADDTVTLLDNIFLSSNFQDVETTPFKDFGDVPSGQDAFALIAPTESDSTVDILVTGFKLGVEGTVNVSEAGLGTNSQAVDPLESLRIDFVTGGVFSKADEPAEVHDAANIDFANHVEGVGASFELVQVNPNKKIVSATVRVYNVDDEEATTPVDIGTGFVTDANASPGAPIAIAPGDVAVYVGDPANNVLATGITVTSTADSKGVVIDGLKVNYIVVFTTADRFDRMIVTNSSATNTFDLGNITFTSITDTSGTETVQLGSHIIVQDDGPAIAAGSANPALSVSDDGLPTSDDDDFSQLFDVDFGADGEGSVAYSLKIGTSNATGLTETASGKPIFLFLDGSELVGRSGTDSAAAALNPNEVFRVGVDSDGKVSVDQTSAIYHDATHDTAVTLAVDAGLIILVATATDDEATPDSASREADISGTITFNDDTPGFGTVPNGTVGPAAGANAATGIGAFTADGGGDGGHVTISGWADLSGVGLTATSSAGGTVVTYKDVANDPVYRLTVTDTGYDFDVLKTLSSPPEALNFGGIASGGPQETLAVPTMSGSHTLVFDGLLFTGSGPGGSATEASFGPYDLNGLPGDDLNPDAIGFGVKNGQASQVNHNEGFFFSESNGLDVQNLTFDVAGIGNVKDIRMESWLYNDAGELVDYNNVLVDGLKAGNKTVSVADNGGGGGAHDAAGELFDTAYVRFSFDDGNTNKGVRIINFFTQIPTQLNDRDLEFQLTNTDGDTDTAVSNIFHMLIDNPLSNVTDFYVI